MNSLKDFPKSSQTGNCSKGKCKQSKSLSWFLLLHGSWISSWTPRSLVRKDVSEMETLQMALFPQAWASRGSQLVKWGTGSWRTCLLSPELAFWPWSALERSFRLWTALTLQTVSSLVSKSKRIWLLILKMRSIIPFPCLQILINWGFFWWRGIRFWISQVLPLPLEVLKHTRTKYFCGYKK